MYDIDTRKRALALVSQGRSLNSVSKQTGISRHAITCWLERIDPLPRALGSPPRSKPDDLAAYSYLLGLYLGDGHISAHTRGSGYYLRITCADAWPGLIEECRAAILAVHNECTAYLVQRQGCVNVTSSSQSWPVLFPQHGPGRKHERHIVLEKWQQDIVDTHPWEFIRGLVHSDGCRNMNWTTRLVGGERKRYEYPRYWFTNVSDDIRKLYTDTLDTLGVEWKDCTRHGQPYNISVARRASVALMDAHVGPKY
ncbi:transcriptional regulator [Streptomyces sp. NBC_00237]|uniref:transcriptional regulator n=1 Tax=Streptomyces sp. NBC_00237 TaxID=2975687 RepID=UPI002252191A|nr:transcriptional regulator [Streptomyces sp. NBC_00237]MCX5201894.1 transcriptional regulator [Streptomyces sp. NBC_00237]